MSQIILYIMIVNMLFFAEHLYNEFEIQAFVSYDRLLIINLNQERASTYRFLASHLN